MPEPIADMPPGSETPVPPPGSSPEPPYPTEGGYTPEGYPTGEPAPTGFPTEPGLPTGPTEYPTDPTEYPTGPGPEPGGGFVTSTAPTTGTTVLGGDGRSGVGLRGGAILGGGDGNGTTTTTRGVVRGGDIRVGGGDSGCPVVLVAAVVTQGVNLSSTTLTVVLPMGLQAGEIDPATIAQDAIDTVMTLVEEGTPLWSDYAGHVYWLLEKWAACTPIADLLNVTTTPELALLFGGDKLRMEAFSKAAWKVFGKLDTQPPLPDDQKRQIAGAIISLVSTSTGVSPPPGAPPAPGGAGGGGGEVPAGGDAFDVQKWAQAITAAVLARKQREHDRRVVRFNLGHFRGGIRQMIRHGWPMDPMIDDYGIEPCDPTSPQHAAWLAAKAAAEAKYQRDLKAWADATVVLTPAEKAYNQAQGALLAKMFSNLGPFL